MRVQLFILLFLLVGTPGDVTYVVSVKDTTSKSVITSVRCTDGFF